MALSLYDASVSVFIRGLDQLTHVLGKGLEHAQAQGLDTATLVNARLAPDMLTLAGQVQRASDVAKLAAARIGGFTAPSFADTETTYDELLARVAKTRDFLAGVDRASIEGQESREVRLKVGEGEIVFDAQRYLLQFAIPNFFFHVTTAYDVLRHLGVPVGKRDFLGR